MSSNTPEPPTLGRTAQEVLLRLCKSCKQRRFPEPKREHIRAGLDEVRAKDLVRLRPGCWDSTDLWVAQNELTAAGRKTAQAIDAYRRAEADGLPLELWRAECIPDPLTRVQFYRDAEWRATAPDGTLYHTDGRLMLQEPHPDTGTDPDFGIEAMCDEAQWSLREVEPLGYLFSESTPAIAFDLSGVFVRADYYELILKTAPGQRRWITMTPKEGNKHFEEHGPDQIRLLRVDQPDRTAAAFIGPFRTNRKAPGIDRLIAAGATTPPDTPEKHRR